MIVLDEITTRARVQVRKYRDRRMRLNQSDTTRVLVLPVLKMPSWTAIKTYKWAALPDGRLLETLREGDG